MSSVAGVMCARKELNCISPSDVVRVRLAFYRSYSLAALIFHLQQTLSIVIRIIHIF
jgi:hypothetical protein